jgi:opacity protein-like surface antigen
MKKLALALGAISLIGTASAEITTGYYLGLGVTSSHTSYKLADTTTSVDLGRPGIQGTVYAGYGMVMGCTYLGAELDYSLGANKIKTSGTSAGITTSNILERNHTIGLAFRVGQKFTPSTMGYVRLGVNSAQYKAVTQVTGQPSDELKKRKISFAPGLGMETAVAKNTLARLQYVYDFGSKLSDVGDVKMKTQAVTLGVAYKF